MCDAGIQSQAQNIVDRLVNEAHVSTLTPNGSTVFCSRVDQGQGSMRIVLPPAYQLDPVRRLKRPMRFVNFLCSDSRCRRYVSDLSSLAPR